MAITKIVGNKQVADKSIDLGRLEDNFVKGKNWVLSDDDSAIISGVKAPENDNEVATKKYVDDAVNSEEGNSVFNEIPDFDDGDTEVNINNTPEQDTLRVYRDGIRLREGDDYDYTIDYDNNKVTFSYALATTENIIFDYIKA